MEYKFNKNEMQSWELAGFKSEQEEQETLNEAYSQMCFEAELTSEEVENYVNQMYA